MNISLPDTMRSFVEEQARRRADENFREARAAVDRFFTEVSTSKELLRSAPGTQQLRRRLLEQARDYYVKFLEAGGDDPKLREDVARAYLLKGQVLMEIGNGPEAREALEQGRNLAEEALRADPTNRALRREVAQLRAENTFLKKVSAFFAKAGK